LEYQVSSNLNILNQGNEPTSVVRSRTWLDTGDQ
jgi:hypothetical protein